MNLKEAKQVLKNAGYIVENTISFEQEAENIVYSYGTDEYGLDVDQIVKIMEDASEIKGQYEQTDFISNQIKKITGLTIWDIEDDKNLMDAHFDICNAVFKKTSQRKQNDNLDEAKQILKNAGYIIESYAEDTDDPIAVLRKDITKAAITRFEQAQYDEYEQEPWVEEQNIKNIEFAEFLKVVMNAVKAKSQRELLNLAEDKEMLDKMVEAWFQYLLNEKDDCMGWDFIWENYGTK